MKKYCLACIFSCILMMGCETDFKVVAPYRETMVIDGLLNALDSVQYISVTKAYLGEGDALVMAQQSDSVNYADILDVQLEKISNGSDIVIPLTRVERMDKDPGIFAYPFHVLYSTNTPISQDGSQYRIRVTNRNTGTVATSTTNIVKDAPANPAIPADTIDLAKAPQSPIIYTFYPPSNSNSAIYDLIIRFHYREIDPNGVSVEKSIDWNFSDQEFIGNSSSLRFFWYKNDFFEFIGDNIPDKPGYTRRIDSLSAGIQPVEIRYIAGTEDLQTYVHLQAPTSGIVQERPLYTTVQNGLGLFTSRLIHSYFRKPTQLSEAAFDSSHFTSSKNFKFN